MELTHSFTVPSSVDETWEHFQDIGALAECFPGAQVTSVGTTEDGAPTFVGTCKVKLGPIALVYAGAGTFVQRDEAAHSFVVEATGRDKRGNGTAGATVTLTMQPLPSASDGTTVEVLTELSVTGKPAQFGRGVMQDGLRQAARAVRGLPGGAARRCRRRVGGRRRSRRVGRDG